MFSAVELNPRRLRTHKSVLGIFHLNIRSIRYKIDDLFTIIQDYDIKTHLDHSIRNDNLHIDGFSSVIRIDRNSLGGGVMEHVSNTIHANRRSDLEPPSG